MVANKSMVKSKGISETKELMINMMHEMRIRCEKDMEYNDVESEIFQNALANWRKAQRKLQKYWGFEINSAKWCEHRLPKCTCPKMDNDDMGGHYYFSDDCPIHHQMLKNRVKNRK